MYGDGKIWQCPGEPPYGVYGAIVAHYESNAGGITGRLGHPISDLVDTPHLRGRVSYFEHGAI